VVAGIIFITGLFHFRTLRLVPYLLAGAGAMALFVPHLSIFLRQLSRGGIGGSEGWLGTPEASTIVDFTLSAVNHNYLLLGVLVAALLVALIKTPRKGNKLPLIFLLWFVLSFAFGYVYSVYRNPIMHVQTMVFAFPFLFMSALSWLKPNAINSVVLPLAIGSVLCYTLVYDREHYRVMKAQPFAWAGTMTSEHPEALARFRLNPDYIKPYNPDYSPAIDVHQALQSEQIEGYLSDGSDYVADVIAAYRFPKIETREDGFTFTGFHRVSGADNREEFGTFFLRDTSLYLTSSEYVALAEFDLEDESWSFGHDVVSHVKFDSLPPSDLHLVYDIKADEETLHWTAAKAGEEGVERGADHFLIHGLLLWNVFGKKSEMKGARLMIYLWNPSRATTRISYREVYRRQPNPNRYGLLSTRP
jgi:hypothetical protein